MLWVGAHTEFSPNMWQWINGDNLQTGVPFWAYDEDYDGTENCAAVDENRYYRLVDQTCETPAYVSSYVWRGRKRREVEMKRYVYRYIEIEGERER